ncbi:hypothetical protein PHYBLDRAFT_163859 [Phycomyces blakesleeanus NRRL 1555(-)]|uniref:Uncharacterized protein n=1 Tax=Phycomyces blakesleeanus (strain ATCC 8743b / DSM 1359 / FGSC 10004 / NBRC 33097 / NRRL 1555) TaxID=763407 RepID=A0A167PYE4_PHYB8|nr:hypothetical protein PHYBLDRAFT_163859 [Phycomyces blakesleeanus NRRL 1555(-)]OAD78768.1 hypothetical protein PHYBLDRAFT_163859 [Phycomyces blakesleeanus NRRL 1555(-)]|eukprot:XP_018296808.1 hypothetical protein PHYBLDRAFT_163859 [Phycomyces blakesleeanus NRRL 1555(-)]
MAPYSGKSEYEREKDKESLTFLATNGPCTSLIVVIGLASKKPAIYMLDRLNGVNLFFYEHEICPGLVADIHFYRNGSERLLEKLRTTENLGTVIALVNCYRRQLYKRQDVFMPAKVTVKISKTMLATYSATTSSQATFLECAEYTEDNKDIQDSCSLTRDLAVTVNASVYKVALS